MPFGVTNGVATFQRIMNDFITSGGLLDTFAYLDNVTICGKNQAHHHYNLERFLKAAKSLVAIIIVLQQFVLFREHILTTRG